MKFMRTVLRCAAVSARCGPFSGRAARRAKDDVPKPKEYGVYVKTANKLVRILPNIVFDQDSAALHREQQPPPLPPERHQVFRALRKTQHGSPHRQPSPLPESVAPRQSPLHVRKRGRHRGEEEERHPVLRKAEGPFREGVLRHLDRRFGVGLHRGVRRTATVEGYVKWRRHPDLNRRITVLQTAALPLGYAAVLERAGLTRDVLFLERETGFEPATSTLARLHSTTELFPPML